MLSQLLITTAFNFACFYPLFFWVNDSKLINTGFYRFNLGFSCLSVLTGLACLWLPNLVELIGNQYLLPIRGLTILWSIALLAVTVSFWNRNQIRVGIIALPSILGVMVLFQVVGRSIIASPNWEFETLLSFLGSLVLCAAIFAGVLGHWYLNVIDLPISLLDKATKLLWGLLGIRLLWSGFAASTLQIDHRGKLISMFQFLQTIDGLLLGVGLFFGVIFPLILTYMVYETIKVQSTQSATGILYVLVTSILMGELAYKYYLLEYGLVL